MYKFSLWYFETGWILVLFLGILIGFIGATIKKMWIVWAWCAFIALLGGLMLYIKHSH